MNSSSPRLPASGCGVSPWDAVLLSLMLPGAGHYRSGRPGLGVGWLAAMGAASLVFMGLLLTSFIESPFPAFGVFLGMGVGYLLMLVDAHYRADDRAGMARPAVAGLLAAVPFFPLGLGQFFNRRWWIGAGFLAVHAVSVWGFARFHRWLPEGTWGEVTMLIWLGGWRVAGVVQAYTDRSRREGVVPRQQGALLAFGVAGVVLAVGRFLLLDSAVGVFSVRGGSMEPVLMGAQATMDPISDQVRITPGDRVIIDRLTYRFRAPRRGEIVLFRADSLTARSGSYFAQRVVGLPWERVRIDPPRVLINGRPLEDPPLFTALVRRGGYRLAATNSPHAALKTPADHVDLRDGEYLVLGDNARNSFDGRYWGALNRAQIEGRVVKIYWPLARAGSPLEP